jgi:hypothetical protein
MKYKFEVTYIPAPLAKANEKMNELFDEAGQAALVTTIEISHNEDLEVDVVKQNITWAFQSDGCKVIKIEGGKVE